MLCNDLTSLSNLNQSILISQYGHEQIHAEKSLKKCLGDL